MKNIFYPDLYVNSTYEIDFETYYQQGYRGILFDIDNTLVRHGAPANQEAIALFKRLHDIGFRTCMISNNKEPRVKGFCDQVESDYIYKAGKPKPSGYRRGMEKIGTRPENTLFVGDQIFTDVIGAKLSDIFTIMVKPIHPKEEIQIVLKRIPERWILFFYARREKRKKRQEKRRGFRTDHNK